MIKTVLNWLTGGILDRALSTVDKAIQSKTDQEALKADIIREYYRQRADWMRSGGFWLMVMFAAPLALWYASVIVYSMLFCARCAFPQSWVIASLPDPLNEWSWIIVVSIFGVIGLERMKK